MIAQESLVKMKKKTLTSIQKRIGLKIED